MAGVDVSLLREPSPYTSNRGLAKGVSDGKDKKHVIYGDKLEGQKTKQDISIRERSIEINEQAGSLSMLAGPESVKYGKKCQDTGSGCSGSRAGIILPDDSGNYKEHLDEVKKKKTELSAFFKGDINSQHAKLKLAALIVYEHVFDGLVSGVTSMDTPGIKDKVDACLLFKGNKNDSINTKCNVWGLPDEKKREMLDFDLIRISDCLSNVFERLKYTSAQIRGLFTKYMDPVINKRFEQNGSEKEIDVDKLFNISLDIIETMLSAIDSGEYFKNYFYFLKNDRRFKSVEIEGAEDGEKAIDRIIQCVMGGANLLEKFLKVYYAATHSSFKFSESDCLDILRSKDDNLEVGEIKYSLSSLERRVLVAYQLFEVDESGGVSDGVFRNIEFYYEQVVDELNNDVITSNDFQVVAAVFSQNISRCIKAINYHKNTLPVREQLKTKTKTKTKSKSKSKSKTKTKTKTKSRIVIKQPTSGHLADLKDRFLKILVSMIKNNYISLVGFSGLKLIVDAFLPNYIKGNKNHQEALAKLGYAMIDRARQKGDVLKANYYSICFAELNEDVNYFDAKVKDSWEYSFIALLIMITNDLGLIKWPFETINPDQAVEYLGILYDKSKKEEFELIRPIMEDSAVTSFFLGGGGVNQEIWSAPVKLYFNFIGVSYTEGECLKGREGANDDLYKALVMIAKHDYKSAIRLLESKIKDAVIKTLDARIKALLSVLYEKMAGSTEQGDKSARWLEESVACLNEVVSSRPELQKNLARVYEKKGDNAYALTAWFEYKKFLEKSVKKGNMQRTTDVSYVSEIILVKGKIDFLQNSIKLSSADKPSKPMDELLLTPCTKRKGRKKGSIKNGSQPSVASSLKASGNTQELPVLVEDILSDTSTLGFPAKSLSGLKETESTGSDSESGSFRFGKTERELVDRKEISYLDNDASDTDGDDESSWLLVGKTDRSCHQSSINLKKDSIPHILSEEVVDEHMMNTRGVRFELNDRFLNLGYRGDDFDDLMIFIEQQIQSCDNPVVQSHFIQNKEWLLKMKTYNKGMLVLESERTGVPIIDIKARINQGILELAKKQIEKLFHILLNVKPPDGWFRDPDKLKTEQFEAIIRGAPLRFRVQLGAQFSMAAHVMEDFYDWHIEGFCPNDIQRLYGISPKDFQAQAKKFYDFRYHINPEHKSNII